MSEKKALKNEKPILSLKGIRKVFPGVVALNNVSIDFYPGEVHALIGENGAGKSTFIKTITGAHAPDGGTITIDGKTYEAMTPAIARSHGIECIYQEFNLIDILSAAENICYGEKIGKFVNQKKMNEIAQKIFDDFGVDINPSTLVRDLTPGHMQIVEIAKSVSKECKVLILDEPTAPLSVAEVEILFRIVNQLRDKGVAIIFISHRLDEVFELTDRVSILRDGEYITTLMTKETNRAELIKYMVGREMTATFPERHAEIGDVALELKNLTGNGVKNISFKAHKGEILGVSGLVGAGRTEIMKVVYGAEKKQWGEVYINGELANIKTPNEAMHKYGVCLIPEDRKREGCFLSETISWNIVYNILGKISKGGFINRKKEAEIADYYGKAMRIKAPNLDKTKVMTLSGGNQQKVVVGNALATESEIVIFDEPTRGIDVGAKYEIYELMNQMCEDGKCVVMITSDMEELLGMSDRIVVFGERCLAGELTKDQFSQELNLDMASTGGPKEAEG
ncbi:MAG: sugar ABC transporter ATP-binding protein [Clostridiales bacterium]|nr:sugar ABC transporter ATP-binding protein [Clostridiales bacterium]